MLCAMFSARTSPLLMASALPVASFEDTCCAIEDKLHTHADMAATTVCQAISQSIFV